MGWGNIGEGFSFRGFFCFVFGWGVGVVHDSGELYGFAFERGHTYGNWTSSFRYLEVDGMAE